MFHISQIHRNVFFYGGCGVGGFKSNLVLLKGLFPPFFFGSQSVSMTVGLGIENI